MAEPIFEIRPDGTVNCYFAGRLYKRDNDDNSEVYHWWRRAVYKGNSNELKETSLKRNEFLEDLYEQGDFEQEVKRFPRLGVTADYADLNAIPTISSIKSDKVHWLVEGMILQGSINLLTAPPGGFKTWLSLSLAGAISTGTEFLGHETVKTRVLYLLNIA